MERHCDRVTVRVLLYGTDSCLWMAGKHNLALLLNEVGYLSVAIYLFHTLLLLIISVAPVYLTTK